MQPVSFNQLMGRALFGIPLPEKAGGHCRECGAPINPGEGLKVGEGHIYKDTWVDEGIISNRVSREVCKACHEVSKGSTTRSATIPGMGQVMFVSPEEMHPPADKLRLIWESRTAKKDQVYNRNSLSLFGLLQRLPDVPTPFGLIIGSGGLNDKHFFRSVPLNWNISDRISALVMSDFQYVTFRWKPLLGACQEGILKGIPALTKKNFMNAVIEVSEQFTLNGNEQKLLIYTMFHQKEN